MTQITKNSWTSHASTVRIAAAALVAVVTLAPLDMAYAQHGGGGGGGGHSGGGGGHSGGGGGFHGGGRSGGGGYRGGGYRGYGGYGDYGDYYDESPLIFGSPYCSPALIYRGRHNDREGCY
jgi:uncharacterized membrane protein